MSVNTGQFLLRSLFLVIFHGFWQESFKVVDLCLIAGMSAEEFRGFAVSCLLHPLPEYDSSSRIVSGHGHEDHSQLIGFCFMRT